MTIGCLSKVGKCAYLVDTGRILKLGSNKIDYIEKIDINKLIKPYKENKKIRIFVAYYLRSTRLIDNI